MSAEAKRIATEEALATRSPVIHATPYSRNFSSPAPGDRPTKSDSLHPEVSILHDTATDRPVSGSYGAAAPRWDTSGFAKLLPLSDGHGHHPSATPHAAAPPTLTALKDDDSRLTSREGAIKLLNSNEKEYRGKARSYDGQKDDGKYYLHSLRFAASPHINPCDLYHLGLERHRSKPPPPFFHDLSHLEGGLMINSRAYILANSIADATLPLEVFRPGTLSLPESDRPIADMKETQKAFHIYQVLTRRAKPWDLSPEVLLDFLIEQEWFQYAERPVCGYYRRPSYPAFRAVADLIVAVNRSIVQLLPIRSAMLDTTEVRRIHSQRCSESPEFWAHTIQSANTRAESSRRDKPSTTSSRRNKPASSAPSHKDVKSKVKDAVSKASDPLCITFNLGSTCSRPASGKGCTYVKNGSTTTLEHTCAFVDAAGVRCKKPHAMATNH